MSPSSLHAYVESRFRELFGEPESTLGKDIHWALRRRPGAMPINVLVNGSVTEAVVWVFDPYDHGTTLRNAMASMTAIEAMIVQIQKRLAIAATFPQPPGRA